MMLLMMMMMMMMMMRFSVGFVESCRFFFFSLVNFGNESCRWDVAAEDGHLSFFSNIFFRWVEKNHQLEREFNGIQKSVQTLLKHS